MALVVNTNVASLVAQNNLVGSRAEMNRQWSAWLLASGLTALRMMRLAFQSATVFKPKPGGSPGRFATPMMAFSCRHR